ncbi:CDP-diacylglycerol---serine O-phosphatidyltransferase [Sulfitobacter marinus]|uniref:CDP-diacylglycerol--serine O-phosphatidyltransferase n=1 Tax=Sulfitobacter marinus TaxID=394264 RepID=A0A1I6UZ98_9RHOB|nr:CDP-diacylglycerol--serine O-phosphatidyltransferase [Sulfitobacter marinus]SFT06763.1 CDP-diacylglycerol---serine O-phosphatidyltransferase [Sulfitobacter marinus]
MPDKNLAPNDKAKVEFSLFQLLPNMLTIAAICAGISAIRFAAEDKFALAVFLITLASILDGMDGRAARYLGSDSKIGAELDSLADFVNFGVAPPLVVYFWGLQDFYRAGWLAVLVFAVCCVMRLARFNVDSRTKTPLDDGGYFTGVPSPAGAMLVMLPIYLPCAFGPGAAMPDLLACLYIVFVGWVMISRIPTWSFKSVSFSRSNVTYFLIAFTSFIACLVSFPWATLVICCFAYAGSVLWAVIELKMAKRKA